jgi:spore maturation protein CgeB
MKIAFFGSSLVSAYWNGAATYYRGLLKALAERGHEITFYEPDAFARQQHRDVEDPPWARVVVYPATEADVGRCLRHAAKADVIVKASGVGVFDALLEEAVLELRRPGKTIAFWDVDAPATLERVEADAADPFRALVPGYDVIFTYGGGPPVIAAYAELGAKACIPIYNALDPSTHFAVEPEDRFRSDLTFIGNRLPDREARVDEFFLRVAERLPRRRFLIGGSGWDSRPLPANVTWLGHVYTRDHNALNCSARAVLNINRDSMARYGFSPPTRVFEAAGAGACLITDAWEGIEAFLAPGEEVLVAANGEEVAELLDRLSRRKARCIGETARARVLAQHTYARRAAVVDAVLKGAVPATAEAGR